jgi:hypothetical protein
MVRAGYHACPTLAAEQSGRVMSGADRRDATRLLDMERE